MDTIAKYTIPDIGTLGETNSKRAGGLGWIWGVGLVTGCRCTGPVANWGSAGLGMGLRRIGSARWVVRYVVGLGGVYGSGVWLGLGWVRLGGVYCFSAIFTLRSNRFRRVTCRC